ncbi:hypothetical protein [Streptomyces violascens]|uniref:hypothetical protein n=1 Tax=Streptomyces violascens TaxID=67381 RepID=UPI0036638F6C
MSAMRSRREADVPCAVAGGVFGLLVMGVLVCCMMMSTLSFGAPSRHDLGQQARDGAKFAWTATWILVFGGVLAGLLRLWRTLTVHLVVFGVGTVVLWAAAASR